jgi:cysteine desulfurase / selenocysteine lyase
MTLVESAADWSRDFGPFGNERETRIWLNAAHQGPLPRVAVEEALNALSLKRDPHLITDESFVIVPQRLRTALGHLIGVRPEDVILGNSASHGLQLLASGMPWRSGDEILVVANEFPATIFPWFIAERRGARVRRLEFDGPVLRSDHLTSELSDRTRVLAINWVRSYSGHAVDLEDLARVCTGAGVYLVVNATQGLGALPLDVQELGLAAITSSGFKWLCGPYGTGFSWIREDLLRVLEPTQAYWLALPDGAELDLDHVQLRLRDDLGARAFDIFGTANFLNFMPWAAAIEYLLDQGIDRIAAHDAALVDLLISGLADGPYTMISPRAPEERSAIVVVSHSDEGRNDAAHAALSSAGIDIAMRAGHLRLSPHLYNTPDEVEAAIEILLSIGSGR